MAGDPLTQRSSVILWGQFEHRRSSEARKRPVAPLCWGFLLPPRRLLIQCSASASRWLGELKRPCGINVAALFYKVS